MSELTLEELASKLDSIHKTANAVKADVDEIKERDHPKHEAKRANETDEDYKARVAQENEDEKKEAQEEEKEEEKKEARKARYSAMKMAIAEEDEEKRDAAMLKAMEQTDPTHNTIRNDKERTAENDDEKKENDAAVASIIGDKRQEFIEKILTANKIFNASNIKDVEKRVKKANLTKLKSEWKTIQPFIATAQPTQTSTEQTQPVIPYFANIMPPEQVDASQLNASSPDSAFAQISTKELLEMAD